MSLSIKEASERLGIPSHTIRFYERKGLLPFLQRDPYGNRIFEERDMEWINLMIWFRATGMTVAELEQFVELAVQGDSTIPQRQDLLEKHKQKLQERQRELDRAFEAVNLKLAKYAEIQNEKRK